MESIVRPSLVRKTVGVSLVLGATIAAQEYGRSTGCYDEYAKEIALMYGGMATAGMALFQNAGYVAGDWFFRIKEHVRNKRNEKKSILEKILSKTEMRDLKRRLATLYDANETKIKIGIEEPMHESSTAYRGGVVARIPLEMEGKETQYIWIKQEADVVKGEKAVFPSRWTRKDKEQKRKQEMCLTRAGVDSVVRYFFTQKVEKPCDQIPPLLLAHDYVGDMSSNLPGSRLDTIIESLDRENRLDIFSSLYQTMSDLNGQYNHRLRRVLEERTNPSDRPETRFEHCASKTLGTDLTQKIVDALDIHKRDGFVNGDLKLENIFYDAQKGVKVLDFGRAGHGDRYIDLYLAACEMGVSESKAANVLLDQLLPEQNREFERSRARAKAHLFWAVHANEYLNNGSITSHSVRKQFEAYQAFNLSKALEYIGQIKEQNSQLEEIDRSLKSHYQEIGAERYDINQFTHPEATGFYSRTFSLLFQEGKETGHNAIDELEETVFYDRAKQASERLVGRGMLLGMPGVGFCLEAAGWIAEKITGYSHQVNWLLPTLATTGLLVARESFSIYRRNSAVKEAQEQLC
ncbi:phosphotransferase [Candidatus Woesearchaeota archaeon]|nr:phosphotransferase [Candidatus Woesearchaeota archaeon]